MSETDFYFGKAGKSNFKSRKGCASEHLYFILLFFLLLE